jgi:hypothetical protein
MEAKRMARERQGGCLCGAVRYRLVGEPFLIGTCHCADCRKESGSVFTFYAKWPLADFSYRGNISTSHGRSFCPACGGRLFDLHADDVEIRLGSLDDAPSDLFPQQEGWVKRREHWLEPAEGVPQFEEDPTH